MNSMDWIEIGLAVGTTMPGYSLELGDGLGRDGQGNLNLTLTLRDLI